MEDWSKLITINFTHGYGGDFLATLISGNKLELTEGCTVWYHTPGLTSAFGVKNLDIIVGLWRSDEYREYFFHDKSKFSRRQTHYFDIVFDNEIGQFKDNLTSDLRLQLDHLRDTPAVFNTHYAYGNQDFLPLGEIFPNSTNLAISLDNDNNFSVYKFLFSNKMLGYHRNETVFNFYKNKKPKHIDSEKKVYIDRLVFEDQYSYAAELEDYLKVKFNRDDLDLYKEAHKKLLFDNGVQYESLPHW